MTDSGVTSTLVPCASALSAAARATRSTSCSRVPSFAARASSQARTVDGIALVPLGSTSRRPKVARLSLARAAASAAMAVWA